MTSRALNYRPELDGLRGIAVLAVVIYHCNPQLLPFGYLGVDIFFVISGFVITASLSAQRHDQAGRFLLDFYARRIRRLLPALLVCVLLSAVLISLFNPEPGGMLGLGWRALLGVSNLQLYREASNYFSPASDLNIYTHTWSLGVETQFYLLFPLLLLGCGILKGQATWRRRLLPVLLVLTAASLLAYLRLQQVDQPAAFYLMPTRLWELSLGALVFMAVPVVSAAKRSGLRPMVAALALLVLLASLALPNEPFHGLYSVVVVLAAALLIGALRPQETLTASLSWAPLAGLGLISYSLYLWHWPVLVLSRWTIGVHRWTLPLQLAAMLLLAVLSWAWIEKPLRRASWWLGPRRALTIGAAAVLLGAAWLLLPMQAVARTLFVGERSAAEAARYPGTAATSIPGTTLNAQHCLYPATSETALSRCVLAPSRAGRGRIALLGDSHALRLLPLLGELHHRDGWGVMAYAAEGNAFPAIPYRLSNGRDRRHWQQRQSRLDQLLARLLAQLGPGDVLLLKSWLDLVLINDDFFRSPGAARTLLDDNGQPVDTATARRQWLERLEQLADRAAQRGVKLMVVGPHPVFPGSLSSAPAELCVPMWFRPQLPEACPATFVVPRAKAIQRIQPLLADLRAAASRHPNLSLVEPFDWLCPAESAHCRSRNGSTVLYTDNNHLSRHGSLQMLVGLRQGLKRAF